MEILLIRIIGDVMPMLFGRKTNHIVKSDSVKADKVCKNIPLGCEHIITLRRFLFQLLGMLNEEDLSIPY